MLCADLIEIRWKDRSGKMRRAQGILEDICSAGACLQMESPIPLGVTVHWRTPKTQFAGKVRYCTYREIGYFVGVQFDSESRWTRQMYRPQHLLDLERLMAHRRI
ncbi:MAG: hypothetical protein C5B51_18805 [Terriglobia bacterium]|nr:MAG: hypothetical protein C5B51_18805 [Terriglobia bacterium]